jgi:hypothetical protein
MDTTSSLPYLSHQAFSLFRDDPLLQLKLLVDNQARLHGF